MSTKRPREDFDGEGYDSGSPGPTRSNDNAGPSAKKRKYSGKGKHKAKEGTLEYSKKRARTIQRLFQRNQDLPADVRNDMERELAAHKTAIADKTFQKRRTAMISKYHMVRFFGESRRILFTRSIFFKTNVELLLERKKAMRQAKQVKSKMAKTSDPEELQKLQHELHIFEVDEAYTLYYPHAETYISLYGKPKEGKEDGDEAPSAKAGGEAGRPPMWATIEKAMEEGQEALKSLRERQSPDESADNAQPRGSSSKTQAKKPKPTQPKSTQPSKPAKPATSQPAPVTGKHGKDGKQPQNRRERRALMRKLAPAGNKDEDEDDGEGFFEGV